MLSLDSLSKRTKASLRKYEPLHNTSGKTATKIVAALCLLSLLSVQQILTSLSLSRSDTVMPAVDPIDYATNQTTNTKWNRTVADGAVQVEGDIPKKPPKPPVGALFAAQPLFDQHGVVMVQLFNEGYVSMTKSWICNVRRLGGAILAKTLFIATTKAAYDALQAFDDKLHLALEPYTTCHLT